MRFSLLANFAAYALFVALSLFLGLCHWEILLFQFALQAFTNEFWIDLFMFPFKGKQLFGVEPDKLADPILMRRVARRTSAFLLLFPALLLAAMACIHDWGGGSLGRALHLPLAAWEFYAASLAAMGLLFVLSLLGGLVPLSYRTLIEALMARHERRLMGRGQYPAAPLAAAPPPTHAGVEALPHGLPAGVQLPDRLRSLQRCSPLHARHVELVREHLLEGERAILSTAPAGIVPLPSSSNERTYGGLGLCLAALLLYTALGLFEDGSSRVITRWAVLLVGLGLLPVSIRVLRSSARRQALLRYTDYILTNYRLHSCRAGEWAAVSLSSMEVLPGGSYGEGRGDVELCPESGPETCVLVNVEHADEWCELLERLIYMGNAR